MYSLIETTLAWLQTVALPALLLAIHLWTVGFAAFAPFWVMGCEWTDARQPGGNWGEHGRSIATAGLVSMIIGLGTGIAVGMLYWQPTLATRVNMLGDRIGFGIVEIVFSMAILIGHRLWWGWRPAGLKWEKWARLSILVVAATNLAYHFPVLFEILAETGDVLDHRQQPVDSMMFRELIMRPTVISQVIHFWLTLTICGSVSCTLLVRLAKDGADAAMVTSVTRVAGWILLASAAIQIPVGFWVTSASPTSVQQRLTDLSSIASWALMLALVLALGLIHHAAQVIRQASRPTMGIALHCFVLVYLMCILSRVE